MRDELREYYERELVFLRQMGAEFAQKYPKIATRLQLEADKCEDPHVERLLEAFAFLAGRVRLKIDDEFPEITESLLNVLYPHYLAPVPSMSVVQFALDPEQGKLTTGYTVPRETVLYSRPIEGTPCRFRTCYPVTLWPIEVASASMDPVSARSKSSAMVVRIGLRGLNDTPLSQLKISIAEHERPIDRLRFYINGDARLVYWLYELFFNNVTQVELRPSGASPAPPTITLPPSSLKAVGFEPDEGMLPYTARSFTGYRLLTEYFAFPQKFLFFNITGLDAAARAGFGEQFDVLIYLRDVTSSRSLVDADTLRSLVDADTFQLGCTPIVNLFKKIAEPIHLTQRQSEYHVIPDVHRQMATEIYSIDSVTTTDPYLRQSRQFQPFYSLRHSYGRDEGQTFWYATRRPSPQRDDAGTEVHLSTEVYLSLVDLNFDPHVPAVETVTVHTTCTNRDRPSELSLGGREHDFQVEGAALIARARCLIKPTDTLRPSLRRAAHWRLISHLALNHLSIVQGEQDGSPEALREILLLYDFMDSSATRKQIAGINKVISRRVVRQIGGRVGAGFLRGIETTVEFDEEQYAGSGVFLFASVLERFLGLYASINSFSQLVAKVMPREGYLKRWPPRSGEQILL